MAQNKRVLFCRSGDESTLITERVQPQTGNGGQRAGSCLSGKGSNQERLWQAVGFGRLVSGAWPRACPGGAGDGEPPDGSLHGILSSTWRRGASHRSARPLHSMRGATHVAGPGRTDWLWASCRCGHHAVGDSALTGVSAVDEAVRFAWSIRDILWEHLSRTRDLGSFRPDAGGAGVNLSPSALQS